MSNFSNNHNAYLELFNQSSQDVHTKKDRQFGLNLSLYIYIYSLNPWTHGPILIGEGRIFGDWGLKEYSGLQKYIK